MAQHEAMGFHAGWGAAADQIEALAASLGDTVDAMIPLAVLEGASLAPHLVCADAAAAIDFYKRAFGAQEMIRLPGPDGRLMHASVKINGAMVMLVDAYPEMGSPAPQAGSGVSVSMHLSVVDAHHAVRQAEAAGAKVIMPVSLQFWGELYGLIEDPFGHRWSIATQGAGAPRSEDALKAALERATPATPAQD